jgi:hypothetical protein
MSGWDNGLKGGSGEPEEPAASALPPVELAPSTLPPEEPAPSTLPPVEPAQKSASNRRRRINKIVLSVFAVLVVLLLSRQS